MSNENEEEVTFIVLRTSDAKRQEITIPLSKTLQQLKDVLAESKNFALQTDMRQRIFYLGRELKSGGRSLSKLGLGKHNNHVLHLHISSCTKAHNMNQQQQYTTTRKRQRNSPTIPSSSSNNQLLSSNNHPNTTNNIGVIDLLDDSDEEDNVVVDDSKKQRRH